MPTPSELARDEAVLASDTIELARDAYRMDACQETLLRQDVASGKIAGRTYLAALFAELDAVRAERDRLRADLTAVRAKGESLLAERDQLRADLLEALEWIATRRAERPT